MKGNCYMCLKQDHRTNECNFTRSCYYCGHLKVHHRSLCPKRFGAVQNVSPEQDAEDSIEPENILISSGEMVLMQTAQATIKNPNNCTQENGRMLFESGSQRTYITESLARKLN